MLRLQRDILSVEEDAAAVGVEAAGDGVENRAFPGSVAPDDRNKVTVCHIEGNITKRFLLIDCARIEGLGNMCQLQHVIFPPFRLCESFCGEIPDSGI